ncbi:MAG: HAMP domain-containing protein [Halomonadaceae bacterium]|nr:MAG: HAMP domain-containing protein [Halomonadaceae bacterium]
MPLTAYYLRVYALVLLAVMLVAVLCIAMATGLNQVRHQAWLESAPRPLMSWLAQRPEAVRLVADLPQVAELRTVSHHDVPLDNVDQERLSYGQLLAKADSNGHLLYYPYAPDGLLELRLQDFYRHLSEITARVLVWEINRLDLSLNDPEGLLALGSSLGMLARPLTRSDQLPDSGVQDRLAEQGLAYYQPSSTAPARHYAQLADGQLIEIASPPPFSFWSPGLLLLLFLTAAGALAGLMYLMLSHLHQRLRSIENAVGRIARGEMEARVSAGSQSVSGRLGGAFNRMAEHIQRLVMVQREMIHGVSHELRTPVARIRFGVQMIEDCDDPQMLQKQLVGIDRDIQELDELIDEILTYARLEQGGPVFSVQRIDAVKLVQQVVKEQQSVKPDLTISAQFPGDSLSYPETEAESRYLHRAIQNLVGNATRYARQQVQVHCHFDGETCRVDVHDDGAGVPEEEWEKVFTAFARLDDSRTRSSGGYGLGLSIVRRILHWHGGQAFVGRSEVLGGACFSLVWPSTQPNGRRKP